MKNGIVLLASICALNAFGMHEPNQTALWMNKLKRVSEEPPVLLSPSISYRSSPVIAHNRQTTDNKPAHVPVKETVYADATHHELAGDPDEVEDGVVHVFDPEMGLSVGANGDDYKVETIQDPRTGLEKEVYYPKNVHQTPHEPSDITSSDSSSGKQSRSGAVSPAPQAQQQTLKAIQESPQRQTASAHTVAVRPMQVPMPAPVRHVTLSAEPPVVHLIPVRPQPKHTEQTTLLAQCCVIL